ncbi:MAG TPA: ATP-binding cassette domain-containing protein, partial [Rhizomicrobium sp.]
LHQKLARRPARERAIDMLRQVGIPSPEQRVDAYPHQLSGGMRQRVMIAMALACNPLLLIADEPTTALDVTIQAQVLAILRGRCAQGGTAALFITHNMGVVWDLCDEIVVLRRGVVVESGDARTVLSAPRHPYTRLLLESLPERGEHRRPLAQELEDAGGP